MQEQKKMTHTCHAPLGSLDMLGNQKLGGYSIVLGSSTLVCCCWILSVCLVSMIGDLERLTSAVSKLYVYSCGGTGQWSFLWCHARHKPKSKFKLLKVRTTLSKQVQSTRDVGYYKFLFPTEQFMGLLQSFFYIYVYMYNAPIKLTNFR